MTENYKYGIAFSFLAQDEKLAFGLNELIADRGERLKRLKKVEMDRRNII